MKNESNKAMQPSRLLQNLDWLFRHYIGFCLGVGLGGPGLGLIVSLTLLPYPEKSDFIVWTLLGNLIGLGICLVVARLLKRRFHPGVIARLAAEKQNAKA